MPQEREKQLSYSVVTPGSIFLGCISNISPTGLTISLPNSLIGYFYIIILLDMLKLKI